MEFPLVAFIGRVVLKACRAFGRYTLFVAQAMYVLCTMPLKKNKLFVQMERIGLQSLPIGLLTGFFAGMVLALQTYSTFRKFGSEKMIGPVVALTMARELGPVLTGLMVAGRCSSGIAAEIGTMRITEQIDALETLCINNFQYLIVPRIIASTIMLPFLTIFSMAFGIVGGYLVCIYIFALNPIDYIDGIRDLLRASDIFSGIIKAAVFGFILSSVGAFKGFNTWGGAKGVGIATTQSVVIASIAILVSNYFLSTLLFG
ncbi:ABC transporter permease [Candidatus Babeliales bacterium]|nr:ABC transporter permease [Candidatus Babeliales bacterium]MBP9843374.1 ABC transporter permease [Candidatus Babeliales bacterium]